MDGHLVGLSRLIQVREVVSLDGNVARLEDGNLLAEQAWEANVEQKHENGPKGNDSEGNYFVHRPPVPKPQLLEERDHSTVYLIFNLTS